MKKAQTKRPGIGLAKTKDLKKPFDFCCDINHQDPDTQYDLRIPPFVTSLTNVAPNEDGPDLKFRIQDIGKPTFPTLRSGTHKVKSAAKLGTGKGGRGPLRWYIEEEVALARDIVALVAYEKDVKHKRDQKARVSQKRAKSKKTKELKGIASISKTNTDVEKEGSEKDEEKKLN